MSIHTSLNVTGRAQFGRSLLPEVSGKLIPQFATNLQALITADGVTAETAPRTAAPETAAPETAAPETAAPETAAKPAPAAPRPAAPVIQQESSLNALTFVVNPILKRLAPPAASAAFLLWWPSSSAASAEGSPDPGGIGSQRPAAGGQVWRTPGSFRYPNFGGYGSASLPI